MTSITLIPAAATHHYEVHVPAWGSDSMHCYTQNFAKAVIDWDEQCALGRVAKIFEHFSWIEGIGDDAWYLEKSRELIQHDEAPRFRPEVAAL